jgi:Flp pilus assembly protein TadG
MTGIGTIAQKVWRGRSRAVAAVEFGLVAPVFCLLFAGMVDFGGTVYMRLQLESAVSTGINYALVNAASVTSTSGAALASSIAALVANDVGGSLTSGTIVVNDGPTVTITNGTATSGGTASAADSCYCPSGSPTGWSFGAAVTCGSTCAAGGLGGKFVTVSITQTYSPLFASYGLVTNGAITAAAIVQTQ